MTPTANNPIPDKLMGAWRRVGLIIGGKIVTPSQLRIGQNSAISSLMNGSINTSLLTFTCKNVIGAGKHYPISMRSLTI